MVKITFSKAQFETIQRAAYFYYEEMSIDLQKMIDGNFAFWIKYIDVDYKITDPIRKLYQEAMAINNISNNLDFLRILQYQNCYEKSELLLTTENIILLHKAAFEFYCDLKSGIYFYNGESQEKLNQFHYKSHSGKGDYIKINPRNIKYFVNLVNEMEDLFFFLRHYFENNYPKSREEREEVRRKLGF